MVRTSRNKEGRIMRQTSRILGLALLIAAVFVVPALLTKAQEPSGQMKAQTVTIKGNVSNVSDTSITIVDSNKAEMTIAIDANTKITKSAKAAKATDIKANDAVEVVASKGEGDALTAVTIKVG